MTDTHATYRDIPVPTKGSKPKLKPKLSRAILEKNNVFFEGHMERQWPLSASDFPNWLQPIYEHMRHHRRKIPGKLKGPFEKSFDTFCEWGEGVEEALETEETEWDLCPKSENINESLVEEQSFAMLKSEIQDCTRISQLAIRLRERPVQEEDWKGPVYNKIFRTYDEMCCEWDDYDDLFDRWTLHADVAWNECDNGLSTAPRPDLTYAFPIINDHTSEIAAVYRFDRDVENFTLSALGELRNRQGSEIIPSPKKSLHRFASKKPRALGDTDLICFPWAIVEFKTSAWRTNGTEYCFFQAANASAEALIMREKLAERVSHPSKDARVIFSFACVGPNVRLFVTYRDDTESAKIWMRCIWATSLECAWGVFALRMVIDNVRKWVYRRVKPEIARWIHCVRTHPTAVYRSLDGCRGKQRQRAASHEPQSDRRPITPPESPKHSSHSKSSPVLTRGKPSPAKLNPQKSTSHFFQAAKATDRLGGEDKAVDKRRRDDEKEESSTDEEDSDAEEVDSDADEVDSDIDEEYSNEEETETEMTSEDEDDDEDEDEDERNRGGFISSSGKYYKSETCWFYNHRNCSCPRDRKLIRQCDTDNDDDDDLDERLASLSLSGGRKRR
ncbi:hypothetical protein AA0117_g9192 [Alternaria alternata]|uniref:Uncharacterized protein n=1 Tax=Alternaria alternata TaxID=5599 RepID=A0A4Q4N7V3_ALTAL|nr:hypothetical protein AA0117_g9192 [Alternaria alternata]